MKKSLFRKILIGIAILTLTIAIVFIKIINPKKAKSANFTSASATMSNSRLSYYAGIASGTTGQTLITIDGSANPDNDTNHLFIKDTVCFAPATLVGCTDNIAYTVATVTAVDGTTFNTSAALTTSLGATDFAISTQSGTLSLTFTLANGIPNNGDILVTIPMADNKDGNDGFPDYGAAAASNGFDLNSLATGDVTVTESCGGTFTVAAVNEGSGSTDHTIEINNATGACAASSVITITVGDTDTKIINPAPRTSGHIQGQADIYTINVKSRDGSNNTIDTSDVLVAPIEAVFVSATVDETLAFRVCGVKTDLSTQEATCFTTPSTVCNQASLSVATYAYSVPFGLLSTTDTFYNAAQYLLASTNADAGYAVTIQQNDQMGKNGVACAGDPTDPVTTNCIPDNKGDATLNYDTSDDCDTAANNGLCFSMDDGEETGSPTFAVKYNVQTNDCDVSPTFCARAAADQEPATPETPQTIISGTGPVASNDAFVCWRISVDALQPAGYYYNKVKYTATATF
ncbi:MAG: hypothetical protein ABIJ05_03585 [Patescibacteria group bacterium]